MTATVHRYRLMARSAKFAWYWAYFVVLNGERHDFGRYPLAGVKSWCRRAGATAIVEDWKSR